MEIKRIRRNGTDPDALETAPERPARASCVSAPTALYRHFDKDGALLYIGISLNAMARLAQHRAAAHWFKNIANVTIEWHPSREDAMEAERRAIQTEDPLHNIVHATSPSPQEMLADRLEASRALLAQEVARFQPSYTIKEAAVAVGISESSMKMALAAGHIPYFVSGFRSVTITGWAVIEFLEALQAGSVAAIPPQRLPDGRPVPPPTLEYLVESFGQTSVAEWVEIVKSRAEAREAEAEAA